MARVCIFCGAHAGKDERYRALAAEVAGALAQAGYGIVYGGGRVGLMGSVADAMLARGGEVIGVIPRTMASSEVAHDGITRLHVVDTMHERKALMAQLSDAFIALPGGYGTMDEFHEILTWRQLRVHDKPIGLLNNDGYYDDLLALYARMRSEGFISSDGRPLFASGDRIEELLEAMGL
ncbi:MAG TPA: TIGR00730 family Rossman fold protein [Candidatus Baltobacteraceae bacterium]|nr:TIGR00730 family Rossman fold protein [Candidatus Baltobacteraceae bacterium]